MSFFKGNAGDSVREHGVEKSKRAAMPIWNYHRYFEGYVEHDIYTKSGKVKTERIYAADYFCPSVDRHIWMAYKFAYMLLMIILGMLFFEAASKRIVLNAFWFVAFSQALLLGAAAWLLVVLISYVFARQKMTVYEYKTIPCRMKKLSTAVAVLALMLALESVAIGAAYKVESVQSFLCAGQYALCAGAAWCIRGLESQLTYDRIPSEYQKQSDDVEL